MKISNLIYVVCAILVLLAIQGCGSSGDLSRADAKAAILRGLGPHYVPVLTEYDASSADTAGCEEALNTNRNIDIFQTLFVLNKVGLVTLTATPESGTSAGHCHASLKATAKPFIGPGTNQLHGINLALGDPQVHIVAIEKPSENIRIAVYKLQYEANKIGRIIAGGPKTTPPEQREEKFIRSDNGWQPQAGR